MIFLFLFLILLLQQHLNTIHDSHLFVCHVDHLFIQRLCKCVTHLQHRDFEKMKMLTCCLGSRWHQLCLPAGTRSYHALSAPGWEMVSLSHNKPWKSAFFCCCVSKQNLSFLFRDSLLHWHPQVWGIHLGWWDSRFIALMYFIKAVLITTKPCFWVYPKPGAMLLTTLAENALTYFPDENVRNSEFLQQWALGSVSWSSIKNISSKNFPKTKSITFFKAVAYQKVVTAAVAGTIFPQKAPLEQTSLGLLLWWCNSNKISCCNSSHWRSDLGRMGRNNVHSTCGKCFPRKRWVHVLF